LGVPLILRDKVIGVASMQSNQPNAYTPDDIRLLETLGSQAAISIENARLFEQTQAALAEVEATHRRYLREQWETFAYSRAGAAERILGYADGPDGLIPAGDESLAVAPAARAGSLRVPIKLRDESIGVLEFLDKDTARAWSEDEITLVEALADQAGLALENARLFEQTQRLAGRERLINEITARIRASTGVPGILQTAARELATAMNVPHAVARIRAKAEEPRDPRDGTDDQTAQR
jgi:GAF domain-containing protein